MKKGKINQELIDVMLANVRMPEQNWGDLKAQFASLNTGERRVHEMINKFGVDLPSILSHPRDIWGIESPATLPATYFINPEGEIVQSLFRPQTQESLEDILGSLKEIL